ncbi:MAG: RagB/SusD family nutrient uptake outer membrane protein [Bacteroidetes bacterium]|nr:MAG: RagB/SusD family nutrient uptake outer membrane protein [Bacteroidota bacterium]
MKNSIFSKFLLVGALLAFVNQSCTDLDTELYSEITPDDFFQTDAQFISALGAAYTALYGFMGDYYAAQEVTTDEVVVPTRGADWDDGGHWRRLHTHNYNGNDPIINGTWNFGFGGISTCNRLIDQISELADPAVAAPFIAELRGLRALFYWFMLDTYGNIPIQTGFLDADPNPPTASRTSVFDFVESELKDIVGVLPKNVDQSTYARINFYVAQAILANLYIMAEVYTGTARWGDAVAACNEIINSGLYRLENDYFSNFKTVNDGSRENIFVIPYDAVNAGGFNLHHRTLHYLSQQTYNFQAQPWNGYCSLQEFYEAFDDEDVRKGSFITGPQFSLTGERLMDESWEQPDPNNPDKPVDPDGAPLTFTPEVNELAPFALRQAGARIGKFEFAIGSTPNLDNDYPIFRYAYILLIKAEALWRQDNGSAEALALVNQVRERAGLDMLTSLTEDDLYWEIRREMCFEAFARPVMLRFNRYNDEWWGKTADANDVNNGETAILDPHVNIFPIPESQLNANPNLVQNPGY